MHKSKMAATAILKNISFFTFWWKNMCNTTISSVNSMVNLFLTLFSYFEVSFMHKSKMVAIDIFENRLFYSNFNFVTFYPKQMCNIIFQSLLSTINSFLTYYFYFDVSLMHKSNMAATAILKNIVFLNFKNVIKKCTIAAWMYLSASPHFHPSHWAHMTLLRR